VRAPLTAPPPNWFVLRASGRAGVLEVLLCGLRRGGAAGVHPTTWTALGPDDQAVSAAAARGDLSSPVALVLSCQGPIVGGCARIHKGRSSHTTYPGPSSAATRREGRPSGVPSPCVTRVALGTVVAIGALGVWIVGPTRRSSKPQHSARPGFGRTSPPGCSAALAARPPSYHHFWPIRAPSWRHPRRPYAPRHGPLHQDGAGIRIQNGPHRHPTTLAITMAVALEKQFAPLRFRAGPRVGRRPPFLRSLCSAWTPV
jgi:hypothetical protein